MAFGGVFFFDAVGLQYSKIVCTNAYIVFGGGVVEGLAWFKGKVFATERSCLCNCWWADGL